MNMAGFPVYGNLAHNPEVGGSNPPPATIKRKVETSNLYLLFCVSILYIVVLLGVTSIYSIFLIM